MAEDLCDSSPHPLIYFSDGLYGLLFAAQSTPPSANEQPAIQLPKRNTYVAQKHLNVITPQNTDSMEIVSTAANFDKGIYLPTYADGQSTVRRHHEL